MHVEILQAVGGLLATLFVADRRRIAAQGQQIKHRAKIDPERIVGWPSEHFDVALRRGHVGN